VLVEHTPAQRAAQLESYWKEARENCASPAARRNAAFGEKTAKPVAPKTLASQTSGRIRQPAGARPV
ncbi:MAG TPA: hypothetical protein VJ732_17920, partial [Bryobacteraceae bacterium]|nr:hypothetical protein [Bryobacteraceae bacterium]